MLSKENALNLLKEKIGFSELFENATITHLKELDREGLYAFSVMPFSTGKAGEVIYMIGENKILTSGNIEDFNRLMRKIGVGVKEDAITIEDFFSLFLRMLVCRRGVLLYQHDGHILLKPEQWNGKVFQPPSYYFDNTGAHFAFWAFDTDRYVPVFYSVTVDNTGNTNFHKTE